MNKLNHNFQLIMGYWLDRLDNPCDISRREHPNLKFSVSTGSCNRPSHHYRTKMKSTLTDASKLNYLH